MIYFIRSYAIEVGRENQLGIYEIPVVEAVNPNGYIERHSPGEMVNFICCFLCLPLVNIFAKNSDGVGQMSERI